jgi:hypothetical protein
MAAGGQKSGPATHHSKPCITGAYPNDLPNDPIAIRSNRVPCSERAAAAPEAAAGPHRRVGRHRAGPEGRLGRRAAARPTEPRPNPFRTTPPPSLGPVSRGMHPPPAAEQKDAGVLPGARNCPPGP